MEKTYNVSEAAKKIEVSVKTLQRWDRDGKLVASRTPSNRRYYTDSQLKEVLNMEDDNMERSTYIITLGTTEEKAINKYYHTLLQLGDKLDTMDFISFKYPDLEVEDTEENINMLVERLQDNGFKVSCSRKLEKKSGIIYRNGKYLYRFTNVAIEMAEKFLADSIWRSCIFDGLQITTQEVENIIMNASENTKTEVFVMNMKETWSFLLKNLTYGNNIYMLMMLNATFGDSLFQHSGEIVFDSEYYDSSNLKIPYIDNIIREIEELDKIEDAELKAIKFFCYTIQKKIFVEGNVQIANFIANIILIQNHIGIFQFPTEKSDEFKDLLSQLEFGNDTKIINFIKNNCIRRVQQSLGDALESICKDDKEMIYDRNANVIVKENGKIIAKGNVVEVKDIIKDNYNEKIVIKWITHFNEVTLIILEKGIYEKYISSNDKVEDDSLPFE